MVLALNPDRPSTVVYVNPQFTRIFGYTLADLQHAHSAALLKLCDDQDGIKKITQAVIEKHPSTFEVLCLRKDGSHFPSKVSVNFSHEPDGVCDYLVIRNRDVTKEREIELKLIESNNSLISRNNELLELASHDELTGLYNRRFFDEQLERLLGFHIRHRMPICIAFTDIDYYKQYNDFYGHVAGDEIIKRVAREMTGVFLRLEDIIARYGGDEFVIASACATDRKAVYTHFETLRKRIESLKVPHDLSDCGGIITLSLGVFVGIPTENDSTEDILRAADEALYQAKDAGRNKTIIFSPRTRKSKTSMRAHSGHKISYQRKVN